MSDAPTDAQIDEVLTGARNLLLVDDHQGAYELLQPLHEGGTLDGDDLGAVAFHLGEACLGLDGLDAAAYYFEEASRLAPADQRQQAQERLAQIGRRDDAIDAEADGVAGQDEATAVLRAADDALGDADYATARHYYQQAYEGIQMSREQIAACAIGLARCELHDGDPSMAEGYVQVAEPYADSDVTEQIKEIRSRIAQLEAGAAAAEDGEVQHEEIHELYLAGRAAAFSGDWEGAYQHWKRAYDSGMLPATMQGSFAYNLGLACTQTHDYDAAYGFFQEAQSTGPTSSVEKATAWITRLAEVDQAIETAYEIDVETEIDADLPSD